MKLYKRITNNTYEILDSFHAADKDCVGYQASVSNEHFTRAQKMLAFKKKFNWKLLETSLKSYIRKLMEKKLIDSDEVCVSKRTWLVKEDIGGMFSHSIDMLR